MWVASWAMINLEVRKVAEDEPLIIAQALAKALDLSVETVWEYPREERIPCVGAGEEAVSVSTGGGAFSSDRTRL